MGPSICRVHLSPSLITKRVDWSWWKLESRHISPEIHCTAKGPSSIHTHNLLNDWICLHSRKNIKIKGSRSYSQPVAREWVASRSLSLISFPEEHSSPAASLHRSLHVPSVCMHVGAGLLFNCVLLPTVANCYENLSIKSQGTNATPKQSSKPKNPKWTVICIS